MFKRGRFTRPQLWFLLIVLNATLVVLGVIFLSRRNNANGRGVAGALLTDSVSQPRSSSPQYYATPTIQPESFTFDPNEADSTQLLRLGLAPFQVRSIYRFRAKGGRFSTKDDFRRVYRLTNEQWEHLAPLIRIGRKYQLVDVQPTPPPRASSPRQTTVAPTGTTVANPDVSNGFTDSVPKNKPQYPVKLTGDETINLNTADSALLCRVPGIGPYFARQILRYRRQLGGYSSTAQLLEIENFPANSIAWMQVPDTTAIQKLQVNQLSTRKLMKHPYMGYYRALDIENHRRVFGPLRSIDDLRQLPHFTEDDIQRLKPYLEF